MQTIIPGGIQPVQLPGKSWKKIHYEDHTFEQGRTNAVYPMTHLFINPMRYEQKYDSSTLELSRVVTRTGVPVSIIYSAHFELETTFNAMNELLCMLTMPQPDFLFRMDCGVLKKNFSFIVDNGHGEDPDSQMCLARLLFVLGKFLNSSLESLETKYSREIIMLVI